MEVNLINALILICLSILAVIFGVLPITADPAVLKLSLLAPMFVLSLVYGLLPNMLRYLVCDVKQTKLKSISSLISSLLTCFAGGVILGLCILDLMPTAMYDFKKVKKFAHWTTEYPFVELFIGLGLLLMFLIDELVKKAFHEDEDDAFFDENANTIMRSISEDTTASGHRTAAMFEAIRAASIRHREFGLDRKRTGTMSTFQVFSPKTKTMNRHTAKIFAMKEKNKKVTTKENTTENTPHRTATCPEMINKKKYGVAKKTSSFMIDNKNITTPEIKLRRELLLQAFQEKSFSLDSGDKIQKKLSTVSEHEDKELPILDIFQEKKLNENLKKSRKSIKFALTTTNTDAECGKEENDYFPLPDVIDTTQLNGTE
uniref:Uncharacterized protein n=1 Tax=Acrobeloides nanus TaxID=290746 RepID=A0A914EEZ8_9BILA